MDPFHLVHWATDALDQIRREVWNAARRGGHQQHVHDLKGARWADEAIAQVGGARHQRGGPRRATPARGRGCLRQVVE